MATRDTNSHNSAIAISTRRRNLRDVMRILIKMLLYKFLPEANIPEISIVDFPTEFAQ